MPLRRRKLRQARSRSGVQVTFGTRGGATTGTGAVATTTSVDRADPDGTAITTADPDGTAITTADPDGTAAVQVTVVGSGITADPVTMAEATRAEAAATASNFQRK